MKRFLAFWALLAFVYVVVRFGLSIAVFRHIDVTHAVFAQSLLVPALQALVVVLLPKHSLGREEREALPESLRSLFASRLVLAFVAFDLAVVGLGCSYPAAHARFGFASSMGLPVWSIVFKAISGAILLIRSASLVSEGRERVFLGLSALAFLAYGLDAPTSWILRLPALIFPHRSAPALWLLTAVPLFTLALGWLLLGAERIRARSALAALLLEAAAALSVASAVVVILQLFLRPYLLEPWRIVVSTLSYLAFAAAFLGVVAGAGRERSR